jgi:N-methylhydantoinase B
MEIVKANSREPIANEGDIYALIACCEAGRRGLRQMMDEFGIDHLDAWRTTSSTRRYRGTLGHRGAAQGHDGTTS